MTEPRLPHGWVELGNYKLDEPGHAQSGWYCAYAESQHIHQRVPEEERYANGSAHVSACKPTLEAARAECARLAHIKQKAFDKRKIKRRVVYEAQGPRGW